MLNKEDFYLKIMQKIYTPEDQKIVPDPFLILINNSKQPLHARNYVESKIFERGLLKSLQKNNLFSLRTQSLLMNKIAKNKRCLQLVTIRSSGYKTSSEKIPIY